MKRLVLTANIVFLLVSGNICLAGTWLDNFDDGDLWLEWQFFDGSGTELDLVNVTEEAGRLTVPISPGSTMYMSAGQFDGDLEFKTQFLVPPITAEGTIGVVLRQAPWEEGNSQVYIRLDHKPGAENTNFVAGDGISDDAKSLYTAYGTIVFDIRRTGSEVTALVTEDEDAPIQLGGSFMIPEGPVQALLQFSAPDGVDNWNAEVEEVSFTGDSVEEKMAVSGAPGASEGGRPFVPNQAGILANQGFRFLRNGQVDQALSLYSQAQAIMPKRYGGIYQYVRDELAPRIQAEGFDAVMDSTYKPDSDQTIREWLGK